MNPRRPSRAPGGASRGQGGSPGPEDTPAQTNLGLLLQRALKEAQQTAQAADTIEPEEIVEAIEDRDAKLCADCWNAKTFRTDSGQHMARCGKDLWLRASYPLEDLNNHRVRRWYTDCPEYDDSE